MIENAFQVLEFSIFRFSILFILTILIYRYFTRGLQKLDRFAVFIFVSLLFIYSGLGASFSMVPFEYIIFYFIYIIFFLYFFSKIAFKKFVPVKVEFKYEQKLDHYFSNKNSTKVIVLFLTLSLFNNLYPDFNILSFFSFKKPQLIFDVSEGLKRDFIQTLLFYITYLLQPFYFIALYKYRQKPLKFFILLFLPLYFIYSTSGYIARSTLAPYFVLFILTTYLFNEKYRKSIILGSILLFIPFVSILFYFSIWRAGGDSNDISIKDAIFTLFAQETYYPILYKFLKESTYNFETINFFKWLFTLPIPSFLKGPSFSIYVNYEFTEILTGGSRNSQGFSVLLPGLVTEAFYLFGKYFIFVVPIIAGSIMGFLYKILCSNKALIVLQLYFILMLFPLLTRAGIISTIPPVINSFLVLYIFLIWAKQKSKSNNQIKFDSE